jgi:hypothetical protein
MCNKEKYITARSRFCQLAINDNKAAAAELKDMATGLANCRNTSDVIAALTEIFAVSERTIFRDIQK